MRHEQKRKTFAVRLSPAEMAMLQKLASMHERTAGDMLRLLLRRHAARALQSAQPQSQ